MHPLVDFNGACISHDPCDLGFVESAGVHQHNCIILPGQPDGAALIKVSGAGGRRVLLGDQEQRLASCHTDRQVASFTQIFPAVTSPVRAWRPLAGGESWIMNFSGRMDTQSGVPAEA